MTTDYTPDTITIQLTQGQVTIINTIDADLASQKWQAIKAYNSYYAVQSFWNGKSVSKRKLHAVILSRILQRPLENGEEVDHINGDKLDNRRENLRVASRSQNVQNIGKRRNNTSGYKGVSLHKETNKWSAKITVNGKQYYLGLFNTPELAYEVYCEKAKELHGEFARTD